jgi:hypothetical protein
VFDPWQSIPYTLSLRNPEAIGNSLENIQLSWFRSCESAEFGECGDYGEPSGKLEPALCRCL